MNKMGAGLSVTRAASANQTATNNIPRKTRTVASMFGPQAQA